MYYVSRYVLSIVGLHVYVCISNFFVITIIPRLLSCEASISSWFFSKSSRPDHEGVLTAKKIFSFPQDK